MSATANGGEKAGEVGHRRHRSNSDPQATAIALAHLRNDEGKKSHSSGGTMRTGSLGSNSARSPMCPSSETPNKQSRLAMLGRLFKPWRWKRKKKSDKFEQTSRTLERKISMRATKEELIKKGVLLPEPDKTAFHKDSNHVDVPQVNGVVCGGADGDVRVPPPPPSKPQFQPPESSSQPIGGGLGVPGISVLALPDLDEMPELTLSTLPDPPIAVSEIGPIPPPPMFSNPSPRFLQDLRERLPAKVPPHQPSSPSLLSPPHSTPGPPTPLLVRPPRPPDTSFIEEVPAKEPQFSAMPKKSALKKRSAGPSLPLTGPVPVMPLSAQNRTLSSANDDNKENLPETAADLENMILWRDYYGEDETCRQVAKIARKDSLALKLSQRPDVKELIDKNILHIQTERERQETREVIGNRLIRRLSLRPTAEELEQRNILKNQTPEELRKEKEQKKKMLLRKLSFRPTIEELKERKIITFNDYVEVTQAQEYDRRADKPWTRLTPKDKAAIRKELNEFKSMEMAVHEESRHLTRFHRP